MNLVAVNSAEAGTESAANSFAVFRFCSAKIELASTTMAIQLQLQQQQRNFGRIPFGSAADVHQFDLHSDRFQPDVLLSQRSSQSVPLNDLSMVEMSTDEIDLFIRLQSERFRLLLQYERNQKIGVLLSQIETKTHFLFQQKDEEIALAQRRRIDLEQLLTRLQMENQERQRSVQENEAEIASLGHALHQIRERISSDAESNNRSGEEDHDAIDCGNEKKKKMICGICNSRISCMLLLPCRHLCSCKLCENALHSCPVCNTTKKATIEAAIF